ncbi:MAG: hypothetical protein BGO21_07800 [Dyadobacter sp. 50-39]|uniref:hypothetical protein n=1 Tax=Dyadobacter sp. 50-39 TaxID=1895756 RepID=UPI0009602D37|nr:hypothetical protein [Dyadobacter sp. 50-39]OJV20477.1 MAG: hypothetical protein BGO21_07800 [Dyadobacter sp. 50-39]
MRKPILFPAFTARLTSITGILNCTFAGKLFRIGCLWPALLLSVLQSRAQTEYADLGQYQRQLLSARSDQQKASAMLSIGFHFLSKPGERENDMKAAQAYGKAAHRIATRLGSDSLQARALLLSSQILKESGKRAEALATLNQAIARYSASGDLAGEGTALMEKRHYYQLSGPEMDERIRVVSRAAQLFKRAGDQRLRGDALLELGDVVGNDGKLMEAIDYLKQADIAYRQAGFPRRNTCTAPFALHTPRSAVIRKVWNMGLRRRKLPGPWEIQVKPLRPFITGSGLPTIIWKMS